MHTHERPASAHALRRDCAETPPAVRRVQEAEEEEGKAEEYTKEEEDRRCAQGVGGRKGEPRPRPPLYARIVRARARPARARPTRAALTR